MKAYVWLVVDMLFSQCTYMGWPDVFTVPFVLKTGLNRACLQHCSAFGLSGLSVCSMRLFFFFTEVKEAAETLASATGGFV